MSTVSARSKAALVDRRGFVLAVAAAPTLLLVGHLLPADGPSLAVRLAGATACVLILPGALILRALAWPSAPAVALAGSFALSLVVVALALALAFLAGTSIVLAMVVVAVVCACAAVPALLRSQGDQVPSADRRSILAVLGVSAVFAAVVWWAAAPVRGDGFFHLGRILKLAELDSLSTLSTVNEFENGGLHPGYAFPLLHGVEALIARFAGVDSADVFVYLPAVLVPLAFVLAYGAGASVFQSWAGGLAFVAVSAAQYLARREGNLEGTGLFELLSQPQAFSRLLLVPAMVALAFTFAIEGGWVLLASLGAAAFSLSAVHPTYAPYVALVFAGFLVARVLLVRGWEPLLTRASLALGAVLVPFGLLLILLLPIVRENSGVTPSEVWQERELQAYNAFTRVGDWFGFAPWAVSREGLMVVAGLLAVPLAGFAARRLWAALVLGGSLAVLAVLLTPPLFTALSEAFSISQSRRLPQFLPIAFAVAGACVVLSRLRILGIGLAAGSGLLLVLLYPSTFTDPVDPTGPSWPVWVALAGGVAALVLGARFQPRGPSLSLWATAVAVGFAAPILVVGLATVDEMGKRTRLTAGAIEAVRAQTAPRDIVFSDRESAYEIAAFAPVYINVSSPSHFAETKKNQPAARAADTARFLEDESLTDEERRAILARWGADWVLVDKRMAYPAEFLRQLPLVYEDGRYALYRVENE